MNAPIDVSLGQVAASLVLVAIAIVASRWRDAGLEQDIAVAVARSFVQLVAIGFVITVIFEQDDAGLVIALLAVMVIFGALTARRRATKVPDAFWPLLAALALAAADHAGAGAGAGDLRGDAALRGPGRRHGDRQRDDRRRGGAEPARRRRRGPLAARSRPRSHWAPPRPRR